MSDQNYAIFGAERINPNGIMEDVNIQGAPSDINVIIDRLRRPVNQQVGMTDQQFAEVTGAPYVVHIGSVFFGNKSKAEEFAEEINAFFQDLDKPLDSSDEGMTGEELETRLSDLIRMAKVAPQINSKAHLLARLSEIQVGLERLLRDFDA